MCIRDSAPMGWGLPGAVGAAFGAHIGDTISLEYGTDKTEVSGKVISELNLSNTISITNLFGEMAREMQNSKHKDWSMDIPILDYELVSLKK